MKAILAISVLCIGTFAAPPHGELISSGEGSPFAYQKDIEIFPTGDSRIFFGEDASRNQFPYQVSVKWGWFSAFFHLCGGSIITARTVVSAAHCIRTWGVFGIVAGILNRTESTADTQQSEIANIISHPEFPGGGVAPNDIALFILASPFSFSSAVSPISLPSSGASFSGTAVLSGWGRHHSNIFPMTLQFAIKNLITQSQCASDLLSVVQTTGPLDNTMVCTSGAQSVTACDGDSGGPLVQNGILVGIVSWGVTPCGTLNAPSVYTRTASFVNWINSNTV